MVSVRTDYVTFYRRIILFERAVTYQLYFIEHTFDPNRIFKNSRMLKMIVKVWLG